jgi:hypothetical protein
MDQGPLSVGLVRRDRARMIRRALVLLLALATSASAQTHATEYWPELDVYWTQAEHQRNMLELAGSSDHESSKHEMSVGVYQDYLLLPWAFYRAGIRTTFTTRDASYREVRAVVEGDWTTYRSRWLRLVNRTRVELRDINNAGSYRVRDRLHLQRVSPDSRGPAWAPYITAEAYYDSRFNTIDRVGGRVGSEFRIHGPLSADLYVAQQHNTRSLPENITALSTTLKLNY